MTKIENHSSDSPGEHNDKDANLTAFLRQYAPPVPEAPGNAEDRLMMVIASSCRAVTHQEFATHQESAEYPAAKDAAAATSRNTHSHRSVKRQIAIVASCSALAYGMWQLYQVIMPPNHSVGELAEIENFWFQNWDGVANAEEPYPWLSKGDSGLDSAAKHSTSTHFDTPNPRQE
jgi:hypothetical protein